MAIQTTTNLSNSIRVRYLETYIQAAMFNRVYDQLAVPIGKEGVSGAAINGSSVQVNFLSDLPPQTVAMSQTQDITPKVLRDATTSITPTSRADGIQWHEQVDIQVYTNYGEQRYRAVGKQMAESVDLLAQTAAIQGQLVYRPAARSSLAGNNTAHRLTDAAFTIMDSRLNAVKCPMYINPQTGAGEFFAIMTPDTFHDLRLGGNVVTVAQYQQGAILLNFELGRIGRFRLIVTPWAKTFYGAGTTQGTSVATTLSGAVNELAASVVVASATNISAGQQLFIGPGVETGTTINPTNERVFVADSYVSTTTIPIVGEGANGGLRFAHASGETVNNAYHAYPVVFGGPVSLAKLFDSAVGEFGEVVGPKEGGLVNQFSSLGWKYYGQYGRWVESWLIRGEFASSLFA